MASGFDKYLSTFEKLHNKLEACGQGFTDIQKHTFFLNGIKDEDFENIKDYCDNKLFKETFIDLKKKAIKLGKSGGNTNQSRQRNNNTTTQKSDRDEGKHRAFKLTNFPSDTWEFLSPEVNQWFINLNKAASTGESLNVKCGGQ